MIKKIAKTYISTSNPSKKFEYAYDSSNNRISEVYSEYKNNTWVYVSKYVFTYDSNNNRISETRYIYKDGDWVED